MCILVHMSPTYKHFEVCSLLRGLCIVGAQLIFIAIAYNLHDMLGFTVFWSLLSMSKSREVKELGSWLWKLS